MKKMMLIWGIIAFSLVGILTFIGITYNKKSEKYRDYEDKLIDACEKYVELYFLYPTEGELKVNQNTLSDEGLFKIEKVNNNACEGYVLVSKNGLVYEYDAYIDCDVYKTKGYK